MTIRSGPTELPGEGSRRRPTLELLTRESVERIVGEAIELLARVGVFIENDEALTLLQDAGARADVNRRVFLPEDLVWRCIRSAPSTVPLFDRSGGECLRLEGLSVSFNPGSAALKMLDRRTAQARLPRTEDLILFSRLTDALPHFAAQSTAAVPSDVPDAIADRYRLFLALLNSAKPVVTGTFTVEGFAVMREMLCAVAGDGDRLRRRPMAVFDACSSQPLKWTNLTAQSLIDSARAGLPAELISVPMLGATAPLSLAGALTQHTAENLSGIVIHQLAGSGSPVIYGGSPAAMDMRHGTIAMGAVETMMLVSGYAQIGRYLGLPTHGYLALSDAKVVDAQAGLESGMGALMAALSGVNMVSGAGMLEFENCQSFEKLVIDNEICGMVRRLVRGIALRGGKLAEDLYGDLSDGELFLTSPRTLAYLSDEVWSPGPVIDRRSREVWEREGGRDAWRRAGEEVDRLLLREPSPLPEDLRLELEGIMAADAGAHGMDRLPHHSIE
ncbi:MAG: trimethylamine methyltransferase family protein [Acidobacteria bacterium]|nr:trimethylamine methyltransferase family protein [Acidobacteriota bacterium]